MHRLWATLDEQAQSGSPHLGLATAGALALVALIVTRSLSETLSIDLPYLFCIAAVLFSAVRNGLPAALLTMAISLTGTTLLAPRTGVANPRSTVVVALFCLGIAIAGEAGVRLRRRERVLAAHAASRQQALQVMFDASPAVTLIVDGHGRVAAANEAARRLFGRDQPGLVGRLIDELAPPASGGDLTSVITEDGRTLHLRVTEAVLPLGAQSLRTVYIRDETAAVAASERLALTQRELYQIARATSLGQLGSSIAHELNQPLAFAANYGGAARAMLDRPHPDLPAVTAAIDDMLKQVFRAAAVLKRLRNFVARHSPTLAWLGAAAMLDEAARLGSLAVKEARAALEIDVAGAEGEVLVDAVQVQQIILNLLVNAAEAVRGHDQRRIVLRAWVERGELMVAVEDSGPGVPNKARRDVFAPFRSTKPDGVGIGLAVCRTIVEAHSGRIWCDDQTFLGGARFVFTLPWRASREKSDGG